MCISGHDSSIDSPASQAAQATVACRRSERPARANRHPTGNVSERKTPNINRLFPPFVLSALFIHLGAKEALAAPEGENIYNS